MQLQKFPPVGQRSYGVNRAHGYGFDFDDYTQSWNDSGVFIAQVETITAVDNIHSIVNTPGLDAIMIGPYDIAGSLSVPGETNHPKVREAARHVVEACTNAGISCMTQIADVNKAALEDAFDQGYNRHCHGVRPVYFVEMGGWICESTHERDAINHDVFSG